MGSDRRGPQPRAYTFGTPLATALVDADRNAMMRHWGRGEYVSRIKAGVETKPTTGNFVAELFTVDSDGTDETSLGTVTILDEAYEGVATLSPPVLIPLTRMVMAKIVTANGALGVSLVLD